MELLGQIGAFVQGLKSVLDIPGILHGTISKGISDGIDEGITKNKARIDGRS